MKLDEIHAEWEKDCVVDETKIDEDARKIPVLHAKYLRLLSDERMLRKKLENDLRVLESEVADRLSGTMSKEDLDQRGWQPERRRLLKGEIPAYVAVDRGVIDLKLRVALQTEKIDVLESVVKMIVNRNFVLKSMIDWIKFKSGVA